MTKRLYLRTRRTDDRETVVRSATSVEVRGQAAQTVLQIARWEPADVDALRRALLRMLVR